MLDVLPALAAGNTVVQKADNQTALVSLYARKLAIEAGIPDSAWTIVVGDGATVGNAVTDSVDYVAFTGSTKTGKIVAERAAKRLIGYSLELGGKNPLIVLPGAKLGDAAEKVIAGAFGNSGQLCVSIERVYVPNNQKNLIIEHENALETFCKNESIEYVKNEKEKSTEYDIKLKTKKLTNYINLKCQK
jgi:succinate-semialdehyde dehydrogenase/glutarate-semialdehyde dehydrogenase